ncbi:hypothetical protein Ae168Ps1_1860c [Pseudonocardia sp. Ae168_Ps1]|nr:hypothetical protein Ae150APs1_1856c [Pseudonocardia sp. Ae150A_Ps1]OLL79454.1 hypothetical protein Ae168Ps1_1860c [Pseudonocardia sp. Ae168_Ps1]OLL93548.1 hypothetical protein Ae356Ps1_3445c [Pseudonocardia sp. Ae356_Ps1]
MDDERGRVAKVPAQPASECLVGADDDIDLPHDAQVPIPPQRDRESVRVTEETDDLLSERGVGSRYRSSDVATEEGLYDAHDGVSGVGDAVRRTVDVLRRRDLVAEPGDPGRHAAGEVDPCDAGVGVSSPDEIPDLCGGHRTRDVDHCRGEAEFPEKSRPRSLRGGFARADGRGATSGPEPDGEYLPVVLDGGRRAEDAVSPTDLREDRASRNGVGRRPPGGTWAVP